MNFEDLEHLCEMVPLDNLTPEARKRFMLGIPYLLLTKRQQGRNALEGVLEVVTKKDVNPIVNSHWK